MRYKITKFFHQFLIPNINYFLTFLITFIVILIYFFLNQTIITKVNSSFSYIPENCAYFEKSNITDISEYMNEFSSKYSDFDVKKISYRRSCNQLVNLNGMPYESCIIDYLDFDSNFLEYQKADVDINFFTNDRSGIVIDEKLYNSSSIKLVAEHNYYKFYDVKVIGTYKTNKVLTNPVMYCSVDIFEDEMEKGFYSWSSYNIDIELMLNQKIDDNLNNALLLHDTSCITRNLYVNKILIQFNDIRLYFKNILNVFFVINILSSIVVLFKYYNFREDSHIYELFYEKKTKCLLKDLLRCVNSFILIFIFSIVLGLLFNLVYYLIFKININFNILSYFYFYLTCFILNILFIIIFNILSNFKHEGI